VTERRGIPLLLAPFAAALLAFGIAGFATREGHATVDVYEQGLAAIGALAIAVLALATRPAWPLSIGIALTAFSGHWDDMGVPVTVDRLLIGVGIVSLLVRERLKDRDALRTRPVDWLLMLAAIYAVFSAFLAGTMDEHVVRYALLDRFSLLGFVLFFVAPKAFRDPRDRQVLLGTLVALGAYLGVTAFCEKAGLRALVFPTYINDITVGIHYGRARGPFTESAAMGLALFGCGVAAAIAAATWRDFKWRRVAAGVVLLCALGVLLTLTRAAWLAAGAGTIAALLFVPETRRYVLPAIIGGTVLVVGAFAVIPGLHREVRERTNEKQPVWDRKNSNAAALRMIADKPLLGFGWGMYPHRSAPYYRQAKDYPLSGVLNIHNVYLGNAVELGLVGALLWLVACAVAIGGAILRRGPPSLRPWKVGLVALAVGYATVGLTTPLGYVLPAMLLWTVAGLAWGEDDGFATS
jgi:O-antigen ligase